jgi:hypothetical protein
LRENNQLKFRCRAALAEKNFTGCIFGDMLFQFPAPQRLKCIATAIQGFEFGSIRPLTAQITPLELMGGYTGVLVHLFLYIINRFEFRTFDLKICFAFRFSNFLDKMSANAV